MRGTRTILLGTVWAVALVLGVVPVLGFISEPDHVVYGSGTVAGEPLLDGAVIELRLVGETAPIAAFVVGSRPDLGPLFELRVPMDSTGERGPGRAREGDEATVYIDGVLAGSTLIGERGTAQRLDVDPENVAGEPQISIDDVAVDEGDAGTVDAVFTLSLSHASEQTVEVDWATADGSAVAPDDYQSAGATASFAPGSTRAQVTVPVVGEEDEEPVETFTVELANPVNAGLLDPTGVGTISADDAPFLLRIADVEVLEGDGPVAPAVFTVSVEVRGAAGPLVEVDFETADGTALAGEDYLAGGGRLTIDTGVDCPGVGAPCAEVPVGIVSGVDREPDEVFFVRLSNPAGAVIGDDEAVGTILNDENFLLFVERQKNGDLGAGDPVDGLLGAAAAVVSPDGAHVYAGGRLDQAVAAFTRDPASGALSFLQAQRNGEAGVGGLAGVEGLAMSPDGAHLYAAGFAEDALAVFARDADSGSPGFGTLAFAGRVPDPGLLDGPLALAPSPDGLHLYAAAFNRDAVVVFSRDAEDDSAGPGFGALTFVGAAEDGEDGADGLVGVSGLAVHCDDAVCTGGGHVYAVSAIDSSLAVFARNGDPGSEAFGLLTPLEVHTDGLGGVDGLAGAAAVVVSQDGAHVYAAGQFDDAVALFSRDAATGLLTFVEAQRNQVDGVFGLDGVSGLAVEPNGSCVYAASQTDSAVTVFSRDATTGSLSFTETRRDGEPDQNGVDDGSGTLRLDGLAGGAAVAVSPAGGGRHVYVVGTDDDGLAVFHKDLTAPDAPLLSSPSHTPDEWSNDPVVVVEWPGEDDAAGTGMAGYAHLFDTAADTDPGLVLIQDHAPAVSPQTTSGTLAEGADNHFHLRACDRAGNCSQPSHLGPFKIDTTGPSPPTGVVSLSHSPHAQTATIDPTTDGQPSILMTWTPAVDALSGVDGYAYSFDQEPTWICSQVKALDGAVTVVSSPELDEGPWFFHICAVDAVGNWGSVASGGRFFVGLHAFAGPNQDFNFRNPILLGDLPSAVGGTPPYTYEWRIELPPGGDTDPIVLTSEANPIIFGDRLGLYRATLVVTDSLGQRSAPSRVEHLVICPGNVQISGRAIFEPTVEQGSRLIEADDYEIFSPADVLFLSGDKIALGDGFAVAADATFVALTDPLLICD